jgi:hypothetical protein
MGGFPWGVRVRPLAINVSALLGPPAAGAARPHRIGIAAGVVRALEAMAEPTGHGATTSASSAGRSWRTSAKRSSATRWRRSP